MRMMMDGRTLFFLGSPETKSKGPKHRNRSQICCALKVTASDKTWSELRLGQFVGDCETVRKYLIVQIKSHAATTENNLRRVTRVCVSVFSFSVYWTCQQADRGTTVSFWRPLSKVSRSQSARTLCTSGTERCLDAALLSLHNALA